MGHYLLQSYLDHWGRTAPEKPALVDDQRSLSYRQLQQDADRIACCLKACGVLRQDRVVIFMKRSAHVVLAILGVLKADAIYVPIDAKAPLERLLKVIGDCQPSAVICDQSALPVLDAARLQIPSVQRLVVFGSGNPADGGEIPRTYWESTPSPTGNATSYGNIDADPAYILYTSGSTGLPKGVTISHLNVMNYVDWAVEFFQITPSDRILGTAPFHFDMSTFDIYASLKAGATLFIASDKQLLFPNRLLDLIENEGVTLWKGVSSLLMYLSSTGSLKEERIPTLEKILFGGEVLATKHLMNWMRVYPAKRFYNVYGPTETTGVSACYPVTNLPVDASEPIPIGKACSNTEILILTEENRIAGIGEAGELCIRGSGVSLGYWGDESKTARVFVRNPLGCIHGDRIYRTGDQARLRVDGNIEYLGRLDFQVKFMGYRIELFEIEQAILAEENVHQAAVLLCDSNQVEVPELVAFIAGSNPLDPNILMDKLGRVIPVYMLPKRVIALPEIPLNDRGKTDRAALRELYRKEYLGILRGSDQ